MKNLPKDLGYWHMLHILEWIMQNKRKTERQYYTADYVLSWVRTQQGYDFWREISYSKNFKHTYFLYK